MLDPLKAAQGNFVAVAKEDEISEGSMFGVAVAGNAILLSKIGGKVYAIDAVCSHFNGYLPKGELKTEHLLGGEAKDHAVVCPVHKAQFDLQRERF
ncbi:MAG: Rieske 2Fe-2S domain-containing protein [Thaumarchaeota archaeon]|nr:Rieske 2Fe-2S domain-containing protein [Nitrososphaerota archaeon]